MEPTPDELTDLNSIEEVASWVPWRSPTLKSVLIGLGVELADPPRIIAVLAEGIITEAAGKHYDSSGPVEPNVDGANKLSDADVSRLTLLWNTCRLKCGLIKSQSAAAELDKEVRRLEELRLQAQAPSTLAVAGGPAVVVPADSFNLKDVLIQGRDKVVNMLPEAEILRMHARYYNAREGPPPTEEEPSAAYLSGLFHLISLSTPPYADFAIFRPHPLRFQKSMTFKGLVQISHGVWAYTEMKGPPGIVEWTASYRVLETALIMLGAVSQHWLRAYRRLIVRWAHRYGPKVWSLLYQADVRMRSERMIVLKRMGSTAATEAKENGHTHSFDVNQPWDWVWKQAVNGMDKSEWWNEEFNEPANLVCSGAVTITNVVDGDAPIANTSAGFIKVPHNIDDGASDRPRGKRTHDQRPDRHARDEPPMKRSTGTNRTHRVDKDGVYTHNRQNYKICEDFTAGKCKEARLRGLCPVNEHGCNKLCTTYI